jgi:hypothetical protein
VTRDLGDETAAVPASEILMVSDAGYLGQRYLYIFSFSYPSRGACGWCADNACLFERGRLFARSHSFLVFPIGQIRIVIILRTSASLNGCVAIFG